MPVAQSTPTREVMSPQWPYFVLSTHIPHIEFRILVCDRLDVETHCGYGRDILIELKLIENRWKEV